MVSKFTLTIKRYYYYILKKFNIDSYVSALRRGTTGFTSPLITRIIPRGTPIIPNKTNDVTAQTILGFSFYSCLHMLIMHNLWHFPFFFFTCSFYIFMKKKTMYTWKNKTSQEIDIFPLKYHTSRIVNILLI